MRIEINRLFDSLIVPAVRDLEETFHFQTTYNNIDLFSLPICLYAIDKRTTVNDIDSLAYSRHNPHNDHRLLADNRFLAFVLQNLGH